MRNIFKVFNNIIANLDELERQLKEGNEKKEEILRESIEKLEELEKKVQVRYE